MNSENTALVYFSPTSTTQTILKEIAKGSMKIVPSPKNPRHFCLKNK